MKPLFLLAFVFLFSFKSKAFFGMLGRDQCAHQQTNYPTYQSDARQATKMQLQGLESQRKQMEIRMIQLSNETSQLQAGIRSYVNAPWSESMLAHMDNGYDCCAPSSGAYSSLDLESANRQPAGEGLPPSADYETTTAYPPEPIQEAPTYAPAYSNGPPAPVRNMCQVYDSADWGSSQPATPTRGALCLQTGFASTPAWYQAACRNGGYIDPQVCSSSCIAKSPAAYRQCVIILNAYQSVAVEKRQLAAQIQTTTGNINYIRYGYGNSPSGIQGGSEAKSGFLSGIGKFLGNVIATVGPFMLDQYISYQAQKNSGYGSGSSLSQYGPPRPVTNVDGSRSGYDRPYYNNVQSAPPPNYGPRYGYGFNYGGHYGAILPGYEKGGFGCSQGVLGGGTNLLATLIGGFTGLNLNANLQSNFGVNGGHAPYQAYVDAYGNQYSGIPAQSFPGSMPPYQPGSIYGTNPVHSPSYRFNNSVPNYYARFDANYAPSGRDQIPGTPYAYNQGSRHGGRRLVTNLGTSHDSYYFSQGLQNQQMIAENEARNRRRLQQLEYQLDGVQNINGTYNSFTQLPAWRSQPQLAFGYQTPPYYQPISADSIMESLLTGGSAYFDINVNGY